MAAVEAWLGNQGWDAFEFQRQTWEAMARGESGLIHCSTGAGKTYAVWLGILADALERGDQGGQLRVIWLTPLRALAADTESALQVAADGLDCGWTVARRTGDTSSHARKKISQRPPSALVTTPESLCLLLSQPEFLPHFASVRWLVADEWHELLGTKRGVLAELAMARLRAVAPELSTWGLSATLGNTDQAARVLGGMTPDGKAKPITLVRGQSAKRVVIDSVLPPERQAFPWAGHLGLSLLSQVVSEIRRHATSIVFTNTRSQAELWFQAIERELGATVGLHHGSLSNDVRSAAENGLRDGSLRAVVSTASLDLGVDFAPVDCVLQVGSPKGVARLLQRAGRSGHQPGATSRVVCVPTNTFELMEIASARDLAEAGRIEDRSPLEKPLDVLCQHLITVAASGGFAAEALFEEVRTTHAYRNLSNAEWGWVLDFSANGGHALRAYPEYARMWCDQGIFQLREDGLAKRHRMMIGTISSDASVDVVYQRGGRLGAVEESFVARMRPGDRFLFGGRCLELIRVRDLKAVVRKAAKKPTVVPRWMGGKMPLSSQMSSGVRARLTRAGAGDWSSPEMARLRPVLEIQARVSQIPGEMDLLIERMKSREGHHLFIFPFEGRLVHEGLAALFAFRLARREPNTFSLAVNDYGLELLSANPVDIKPAIADGLFDDADLTTDILGSIHSAELARRRFREIARISGLVFEGVGRTRKSTKQLTISSSLLYDVFAKYDPANRLVDQSIQEVLENQLEQSRMRRALAEIRNKALMIANLRAPSPFAYPLFVERLREQLSSEELADRIRKMEVAMESA